MRCLEDALSGERSCSSKDIEIGFNVSDTHLIRVIAAQGELSMIAVPSKRVAEGSRGCKRTGRSDPGRRLSICAEANFK